MKDNNINLIFDIYIPFTFGSIMMVFMILRFFQLNKSARHYQQSINTALTLRIIFITVMIILSLSTCFLTLYDQNFWLYNDKIGAIFSFEATIYTAQIGTLVYEYEKNVPIMWVHKLYWIINFLIEASDMVAMIIQILQSGVVVAEDVVLESFKLTFLLILVAYSFIRSQDIYEYKNIGFFTLSIPQQNSKEPLLPSGPLIHNPTITSNIESKLISVQISKQWKVEYNQNGDCLLLLKLKVTAPNENSYKIQRNHQDFIKLEAQLLETEEFYQYSYPFYIPEDFHRIDVVANMNDTTMVAKVHSLQTYLTILTSKLEYCLPPLLEFLQIQGSSKSYIENERNKIHMTALNLTIEESNRPDLIRTESDLPEQKKNYFKSNTLKSRGEIEIVQQDEEQLMKL